MQKDTHPLGLVSADQMFKSKCKKRKHASNLCLQIKCQMQPIKEFAYILHRALHQAIISFSNLIKLKTLWSKTYLVVIIVSVFKVG